MRLGLFILFICLAAGLWFFAMGSRAMAKGEDLVTEKPDNLPKATLAGGCFWCLESEFRSLDGIVYTDVGYAGGHVDSPTYEQVTTGETGHAEAIEIYYDPDKVSYRSLLTHFLTSAHNPTELNKQWVDKGPQYRSAIFYHDEEQKKIAEELIAELTAQKLYKEPIVTEITPAGTFWIAENYHQQYYEKYKEKTGKQHMRVFLKKQRKK